MVTRASVNIALLLRVLSIQRKRFYDCIIYYKCFFGNYTSVVISCCVFNVSGTQNIGSYAAAKGA